MVEAIKEEITGPDVVPSPLLDMLAALPFPIMITTNYDHLFDIALSKASTIDGRPKQPIVRIYDPTRTIPPEAVPLDPTEEKPVLLKLHGDINRPESIVVTEEDNITFVQRMSIRHLQPIHVNIRARMNSWPILLIGYSLKDYDLRLLFRTLRWHVDMATFPSSFFVDSSPAELDWQHEVEPMAGPIRENLWDFIPSLYEEVIGGEYVP